MTLSQTRKRLEASFTVLLKPELQQAGARVVYLVLASETEVQCAGDFYGMTEPRLALAFRVEIDGRWRGNGPAALLDDSAMLKDCDDDVEIAGEIMSAIAVHEMAHMVTRAALFREEADRRGYRRALKTVIARPCQEDEIPSSPKQSHDARFLRAAFHLAHRLEQLGSYVPMSRLLDWQACGLFGGWRYRSPCPERFQEAVLSDLASVANG
jgi:hypothetical protein